ncbi:uncharacterized protein ACN2A1_013445 isoform 1-T6 [Glossina fuscipes fuscipes]
MAVDANLLKFLFGAIILIFVSIHLARRKLKKKSIDFDEFFKFLMQEVHNRNIKLNKNSLQVGKNSKNSLLNSLCRNLKKKPCLKNHVCLIWFYRKNFDKILEKLKEKYSDKRFISTDGKHFSTKLTVSPPNFSSLSEIVCEKPIPFISIKTDVGTQADLWGSDNRDISTILFKFVRSFIEQNPQLTSFPSKIEEDRSINMEMKLPETVAQENLENVIIEQSIPSENSHQISKDCSESFYFSVPFNATKSFIDNNGRFNKNYSYFIKHYLAEAIDVYNAIVNSENEDETISTNVSFFGYRNKTFVKTVEKCPLEIKDIKYQKNNFAHIRAYCCRNSRKDKICLEYDIFVVEKPKTGQPLQCYFTTRGVFNHTFFKTSQVRGYKRVVFREEMKNILPKQARVNFLNKLDNKDLEAYNLGEVKSEGVYKKIRSEIIRKNDLSSDDLDDLRKRYAKNATEEDQFFQYLAEPCEVGLFSRNQVKVAAIAKNISKGGLVCHLDATGSIIRNISDVRNYIFYYALVITNHRGKNYPVAERIASTHDAGSIGNWLMKFQQLCEREGSWPLFTTIVTDFSRALINGPMLHWNKCNIIAYLNFCHKKLERNENTVTEKIVFKLCYAHFKKNVCNRIQKLKVGTVNKKDIQRYFKFAFFATSYDRFKFWFRHFATVLCAKASSNFLKMSLSHLDEMCKEATAIETFRKKKKTTDNTVTFSTAQDSAQDFQRDMRTLVDDVYDDKGGVSTYKDSLF